jgi:hypothetical protein
MNLLVDEPRGTAKAALLLRAGWSDDAVVAELGRRLGLSPEDSTDMLHSAKRLVRMMDLTLRADRVPCS